MCKNANTPAQKQKGKVLVGVLGGGGVGGDTMMTLLIKGIQ